MDKKVIFGNLGGLRFTQESLDFMQQSTETLHTLGHALCAAEGMQYLIVKGCETAGTAVAPGVVIVNGEVLPFAGGTKKTRVEIVETKEPADFMDGEPKETYVSRSVAFTDNSGGIPWSSFKPVAEKIRMNQTAGGDLADTYPNPKVKIGSVVYTGADAAGAGVLVETDIPVTTAAMVFGRIHAHTNGHNMPAFTTLQFYNYVAQGTISGMGAIHHGHNMGNIFAFHRNGKVCIWFPVTTGYETFNVYLTTAMISPPAVNRVSSITFTEYPADTTNAVEIVPKQSILNSTSLGGDLSETLPNPVIRDGAVGPGKLARASVPIYCVTTQAELNAIVAPVVDRFTAVPCVVVISFLNVSESSTMTIPVNLPIGTMILAINRGSTGQGTMLLRNSNGSQSNAILSKEMVLAYVAATGVNNTLVGHKITNSAF